MEQSVVAGQGYNYLEFSYKGRLPCTHTLATVIIPTLRHISYACSFSLTIYSDIYEWQYFNLIYLLMPAGSRRKFICKRAFGLIAARIPLFYTFALFHSCDILVTLTNIDLHFEARTDLTASSAKQRSSHWQEATFDRYAETLTLSPLNLSNYGRVLPSLMMYDYRILT
ncbi:hypothetical protein PUN28_001345 [Cardiocondyla obscurior]|uniref:Uncharacterized protein n=1 Tax=Cardiocondyla obscurior TaxID=286306 RepID=A0AAW2H4H6_9HYME